MSKKTHSLSRHLTMAIVAFAVVAAATISGVQVLRERKQDLAAIQTQFTSIETTVIPTLMTAMWNLNMEATLLAAQGVAKQPWVAFVEVRDMKRTVVSVGQPVGNAASREFKLIRSLNNRSADQSTEFGVVLVQVDQDGMARALEDKYLAIFASNLFLAALMSAFLMVVLEWHVIRHVRRIARFLDSRSYDNLDEPLQRRRRVWGHLGNDEIRLLGDGVSRMQANLRTAFEELRNDIHMREEAEAEVRRLNGELEQRVVQRTQQLRLAQMAAEQVLDLTDSAYWKGYPKIGVLVGNERLVKLLGLEPNEHMRYPAKQNLLDRIAAVDTSIARKIELGIAEVLNGTLANFGVYFPYLRPDGTTIWLHSVVRLDHEANGTPFYFGSLQNITHSKAIEVALEDALQVAETASRAKAEFLANMSHEIRTPMNAIYGLSNLMLRTDLSARQRDYLGKIQQSGAHLLGIINDILDISKIEAGKLAVDATEFEIDSVLENVANLIGDKASQKELELIFDVTPDVPCVLLGDPLRLGQILVNYGNNAVKFTERGEITIQVRLRERTESHALLYFAVRDHGIGLTEEQMERLFQSFEQADASTTRKYGGTGLGLSISKRLAELMGGEVGVSSVFGQGSTFWFTARLQVSESQRRKLVPRTSLKGLRLLVVDDNEGALQSLVTSLQSMSFDVDSASSGQQALLAVQKAENECKPYAMLIVDWMMPEIDGIETIQRIRALPITKMPKVAIATAHGRDEIMHQAKAAGIDTILIKPIGASLLFDTLMRALGDTDQADPAWAMQPDASMESLAPIRGARVLLAEDNAINQMVASELLQDAGLQVDIAENGDLAVAMAASGRYDIVLMDMQMPVMDGLEATQAIRALPGLENLPIVAMTANVMDDDRQRCSDAGMNAFVAKPIEPDVLFEVLMRWVPARLVVSPAGPVFGNPAPDSGAAPSSTEVAAFPNQIDGLDLAAGLRRMMGKRSRYVALLKSFCETKAGAAAEIRHALENGERPEARRIAHTVKGLAGQIAAETLQHEAQRLEQALQGTAAVAKLAALVERFAQALNQQVAAIQQALSGALAADTAASEKVGTSEEAQALLRQLAELLAEDDARAQRLVATNAATLQAIYPAQFAALQQAVRAYDFALALTLLPERPVS